MGLWDSISNVGGFIGDHSGTIADLGSLGMGAYSLYQGQQANNDASDFYDAAGETAKERWKWWQNNQAPLEEAKLGLQTDLYADEGFQDNFLAGQQSQAQLATNQQQAILDNWDQMEALYNQGLEQQGIKSDMTGDYLSTYSEALPGLMEQSLDIKNQQYDVLGQQLGSMAGDIQQYEDTRGMADQYYQQAMDGINVQDKMDQAQGEVANSFAAQQGANRMAASRMGLNPNSGQFGKSMNDIGLNRAKNIASARTGARNQAEDTNFNRLASAYNARSGLGSQQVQSPGLNVPQAGMPSFNANAPSMGGVQGVGSAPNPSNTFMGLGNTAAQGGAQSAQAGMNFLASGLGLDDPKKK